jgi:hypothetical protein
LAPLTFVLGLAVLVGVGVVDAVDEVAALPLAAG